VVLTTNPHLVCRGSRKRVELYLRKSPSRHIIGWNLTLLYFKSITNMFEAYSGKYNVLFVRLVVYGDLLRSLPSFCTALRSSRFVSF
jgi:hypothetical protein